jgi:hypothetical protein
MAVASQNLIHVNNHFPSRAIAVFQERLCWQFSAECQALDVQQPEGS